MAKKPTFQVPFFANGDVVHYPLRGSPKPELGEGWYKDETAEDYAKRLGHWAEYQITWRDPEPFTDILVFKCGGRAGRSAVNFAFTSETNDTRRYTVFLQDFVDMTMDVRWEHGVIRATFIPCKRGSNYGVKLHRT